MTIIDRRKREKEQRRQHLIDIGQAVFFERGYESTSIDAIANRAEYSKRFMYLYFRDKRELFRAVVLRGLTKLNDTLSASIQQVEIGIPSLYALADAYYNFFQDERGYFDLILDFEMREYYYAKPHTDMGDYEQLCQEMNDRNSELVAETIERSIEEVGIDTLELEAVQVTLILWGQVIGILQLIAQREDVLESVYGMTPRTFFRQAFKVSINGVFRNSDGAGSHNQSGIVR